VVRPGLRPRNKKKEIRRFAPREKKTSSLEIRNMREEETPLFSLAIIVDIHKKAVCVVCL